MCCCPSPIWASPTRQRPASSCWAWLRRRRALDVWATVPDQNLGRTWAQYIEFASLGAGIVPAAGVWADAPIEVIGVTADPSPAQLVGVGDAIAVTVTVQNVGSAALPSLTVNGTATGGVALSNAPRWRTTSHPLPPSR